VTTKRSFQVPFVIRCMQQKSEMTGSSRVGYLEVEKWLEVTRPTARKIMQEMLGLGMVEVEFASKNGKPTEFYSLARGYKFNQSLVNNGYEVYVRWIKPSTRIV